MYEELRLTWCVVVVQMSQTLWKTLTKQPSRGNPCGAVSWICGAGNSIQDMGRLGHTETGKCQLAGRQHPLPTCQQRLLAVRMSMRAAAAAVFSTNAATCLLLCSVTPGLCNAAPVSPSMYPLLCTQGQASMTALLMVHKTTSRPCSCQLNQCSYLVKVYIDASVWQPNDCE